VPVPQLRSFWLFESDAADEKNNVWRETRFPALRLGSNLRRPSITAKNIQDIVTPLESISMGELDTVRPLQSLAPTRIVLAGKKISKCQVGLLYDDCKLLSVNSDWPIPVEFPPEWSSVLAIIAGSLPYMLNRNHPTVKLATNSAREQFMSCFPDIDDGEILGKRALNTAEKSAVWVLSKSRDIAMWEALRDNYCSDLFDAFSLAGLFEANDRALIINFNNSSLVEIKRDAVALIRLDPRQNLEVSLKFPTDPRWFM
jgi:hypothetical protein